MRLTVRRMVVAVAIVTGLVTGLAVVDSQILHTPQPVYVAVSASVAALFALGGMRHPWFFLAVVVALYVVLPTTFDSSGHDMFVGCYFLGWAFGSLAGWIIRNLSSRKTTSRSLL